MKRFIYILFSGVVWLAMTPFLVNAFDADGNTQIVDADSGEDWIEVVIAPETLLPEEQYFVECKAVGVDINTSRREFGDQRTLRVNGLVGGITYSCTSALYVKDQDVVRYRSKALSLKTDVETDFVTVARKEPLSDEIAFWLNETPLSYEDQYYVGCEDGIGETQSVSSTDPNGMRLRGLLSDYPYTCVAGLIRDGHVHKQSQPFEVKTKISPYQVTTVTKYEASDITATFWLNGPKTEADEKYYINCDEELNRSSVFAESQSPLEIKVTGLKPETSYSCYGAIVTATDKIRSKGSVVWFRTDEVDFSTVRITDVNESSDSLMVKVIGPDLGVGQHFYIECEDGEDNSYFNSTGFSGDIRVSGLQPETQYTCFGALIDVASKVITAKGEAVEVTTKKASRVGEEDKSLAPDAAFSDQPISDWDQYRNPFPDTNLLLLSGKAAAELSRRQVIGGYEDGQFKGERDVNRAEAAKFLLLARYGMVDAMANNGTFPDVEKDVWYTTYVMRAAELGIINGYPDGFFRPASTINRAEFLKMISKTFALEENLPVGFKDVPADAWFAKYAGAAGKYNLFPSTDPNDPRLFPEQRMSRYDVAIAIHQYLLNR